LNTPYLALVGLGAAVLLLAGCGSSDSSSIPKVPLLAEVCVEGQGLDGQLFVRNLNDFEWADLELILVKGTSKTTEYKLNRLVPTVWPPHSVSPAEPFTTPKDWVNRGRVPGRPQEVLRRLSFFSSLTGAVIKIKSPFKAEWKSNGAISECV